VQEQEEDLTRSHLAWRILTVDACHCKVVSDRAIERVGLHVRKGGEGASTGKTPMVVVAPTDLSVNSGATLAAVELLVGATILHVHHRDGVQ
jgi:hypothetical protein